MGKSFLLTSKDGLSTAKIDEGELISYQHQSIEYIHQKEHSGWNNSDTEMFPVIGPTQKNNFKVHTKFGDAVLDQHGLLRELPYVYKSNNGQLIFEKKYKKNTKFLNRKFPNKSTIKEVYWPYDFTFIKKISLSNSCLIINFEITSPIDMPFMFGYHPAFALSNTCVESIETFEKKISLQNVLAIGASAFPVLNTNELLLVQPEKKNLKINTKGFGHFMLWTEVENMICIEPITHYPNLDTQKYSEKNMLLSTGKNHFSIEISLL